MGGRRLGRFLCHIGQQGVNKYRKLRHLATNATRVDFSLSTSLINHFDGNRVTLKRLSTTFQKLRGLALSLFPFFLS